MHVGVRWNQWKQRPRSAPSPLVGEGGEGVMRLDNDGAACEGIALPPPLSPPHKGEGNARSLRPGGQDQSHFSEALLATSAHLAISLLRKAPSFSAEPPT